MCLFEGVQRDARRAAANGAERGAAGPVVQDRQKRRPSNKHPSTHSNASRSSRYPSLDLHSYIHDVKCII